MASEDGGAGESCFGFGVIWVLVLEVEFGGGDGGCGAVGDFDWNAEMDVGVTDLHGGFGGLDAVFCTDERGVGEGSFGPPSVKDGHPDGEGEGDDAITEGPELGGGFFGEGGLFLDEFCAKVAAEDGCDGHAEDFGDNKKSDGKGGGEVWREVFF